MKRINLPFEPNFLGFEFSLSIIFRSKIDLVGVVHLIGSASTEEFWKGCLQMSLIGFANLEKMLEAKPRRIWKIRRLGLVKRFIKEILACVGWVHYFLFFLLLVLTFRMILSISKWNCKMLRKYYKHHWMFLFKQTECVFYRN